MVDLIYTDADGKELGILKEYSLDLAFGSDENDFELNMPLNHFDLEFNSRIYVDDTEYGGLIDGITVNTNTNTKTYTGRTWHGILSQKIIVPDAEKTFYIANGEANDVIADLIERCDLDDLFIAETVPSGITINNYECRYDDVYSSLVNMLYASGGKLMIRYIDGKVELSAEGYMDFTDDEEWDTKQRPFVASQNYKSVNHLICLGSGEGADRKVIHLFTDGEGGIMPYAESKDATSTEPQRPFENKHYILDKSNQVMFGSDEVAEVLDTSSSATQTPVLLTSQPSDYYWNYEAYYKVKEREKETDEIKYENLEAIVSDAFSPLGTVPTNWSVLNAETNKYGFQDYFEYKNGKYESISANTQEHYDRIVKIQPADWSTNYMNYKTWFWDGYDWHYNSVSGETYYTYGKQTSKPQDWSTNYTSYYVCGYEYPQNTNSKWKSKTYYQYDSTKSKYKLLKSKPSKWSTTYTTYYTKRYGKVAVASATKVPTWKKGKYYSRHSQTKAPAWDKTKKYCLPYSTVIIPTFVTNKYFSKYSKVEAPPWINNTYYRMAIDDYANLVKSGIERLTKSFNDSASFDMDLATDSVFFIGDTVGANPDETGLKDEVRRVIVKKIVKINEQAIVISYELGSIG